MVLNISDITTRDYEGKLITNHFLQEYQNLLINLKAVFRGRINDGLDCSSVTCHVTAMKDFVIKNGGLKCVELLSEYEKNSAIGDFVTCNELEDRILTELNSFKEVWIGMLA